MKPMTPLFTPYCSTKYRAIAVCLLIVLISTAFLFYEYASEKRHLLSLLEVMHTRMVDHFPTFTDYIINNNYNHSEQGATVQKPLLILMWENYSDAYITDEFLSKCPQLNCRIHYDRSLVKQSAAVVHYDRTINFYNMPPRHRQLNQHYVFFLMETPHHVSDKVFWKNNLNYYTLTMSYRRDSDIFSPFGYLKKRDVPIKLSDDHLKMITKSKTDLAACLVSYCSTPSQRELYMAELQKHIDIHVYGKCGTRHCLKESSCPKDCQCEKMIASRYKFYIAFENSVCKDWVTEKIFNRMDRYMVPIVFNRKIYEAHIPPDSFIAVDDFDSPAQLADYLKQLDQNDDLYIKYFKWKETYESVSFPDGFHMAFCQLCGRLQADQSMGHIIPSEAAQNISKWYIDRGECISHYVTKHLKLS
ncbi:Alpha-(1,3)-fucosyltransferase 5 [Trichinella sp. T6]|nr:Alpha-(1,3)-fucosyltransferase 5 [Trichinella sp. T6]